MKSDLIRVRRAAPRDAVALQLVHEASWRNAYEGLLPFRDLQRILNSRDRRYWRSVILRTGGLFVLEYENRAVGYVRLGPCSRRAETRVGARGRWGEVHEIYLHPVFQGVGFGTRLLDCARERFRAGRYDGFFIRALAENHGARRFYERQGGRLAFRDKEIYSRRIFETVTYFWPLS